MDHPALQIIRDEHGALAAMLRSLSTMIERGPEADADRFFEVLRSMLFYVDEFPERLHHPKETNHLFPKLALVAPELGPVIRQLEADHQSGERRVRELQHLLTAWELLGAARREAFIGAAEEYVRFHLAHIELEEAQVLPAAAQLLSDADLQELEAVFAPAAEPMAGGASRHPGYDRLFSRIVQTTPAPIWCGRGLGRPADGAQAACSAG
jgi:hemerythrin-like domain-containing protein